MNYSWVIIFLVLIFFVSDCAQKPSTPSLSRTSNVQDEKLSDEDSIREIVFVAMLRPWIQNKNNRKTIYYITINDNEDPSDSLLEKLRTLKGIFEKDSECMIERGSVVNKTTKKPGVRFSVSKIEWIGTNEVKLSGGSELGYTGGDVCKYTLKRNGDEWIMSTSDCYIS